MTDQRPRYPEVPRTARRIGTDVDAEIQFDLEMRIRELVAQGVDERAARESAIREFGDIEATRRYCAALDASTERSARRWQWLEEMRSDLALAWRGMRRAPGFALVVLLTLAVGIGANTAVFSVVRRVLIDRLPYRDAGRLVRVYAGTSPKGGSEFLTPRELNDLPQVPAFSGVAAFGSIGGTTYFGSSVTEILPSAGVTPNFFTVLGAAPILGRTFGDADIASDAPPVVLISHAIWMRTFGGDPQVIGRAIRLNKTQRTVVGVMGPEFVSPGFTADIWMPMDARRLLGDPVRANTARQYRGIARLRDGASIDRARSDLATLSTRWNETRTDLKLSPPRAESLRDAMVGDARTQILAVMIAALLVLVITCTNIAGLFLARATARRREIAVRSALGAGRSRLLRQLMTESSAYGLAGGLLGIGLAFLLRPALARVAQEALPKVGEIRIDAALLATAVAASIICGIAFGVLPALAATRGNLKDSIGEGARGTSSGARVRLRQLLVTAQVALAILLMIGAGLLVRSFTALVSTDIGYGTGDDLLTFHIDAPSALDTSLAARNAFFANVLDRARALPGVQSVGFTSIGPWNGPNGARLRRVDADPSAEPESAWYLPVTNDYFAAIGTRIIRGRSIRSTDAPGAPLVALISESLARRLFPNEDPIGKRVRFGSPQNSTEDAVREVIGVVADIRPNVTKQSSPAVYVSDWQEDNSSRPEFVLRTTGDDARRLLPALRALVHETNPQSPLIFPRTMHEVMSRFVAPQQLSMGLFSTFALLALSLAALGVYAVMAYVVAARTREFGIRTALGARSTSLIGLVLRQGTSSAIVGCILGITLAYAGARLLSGLLVGVSAHDPRTFVLAPAILLIITLAACALPAWRATRVSAVDALRTE